MQSNLLHEAHGKRTFAVILQKATRRCAVCRRSLPKSALAGRR